MGPPHLLPVEGLGLGGGRLPLHWVLSDGSELGVRVKGPGLGHGRLHLDWGLSGGSRLSVLVKGLGLGSGRLQLDYILSVGMLGVLGSSAFVINGALGGAPGPPKGLSVPWRLWVQRSRTMHRQWRGVLKPACWTADVCYAVAARYATSIQKLNFQHGQDHHPKNRWRNIVHAERSQFIELLNKLG